MKLSRHHKPGLVDSVSFKDGTKICLIKTEIHTYRVVVNAPDGSEIMKDGFFTVCEARRGYKAQVESLMRKIG